MLRWLASDINFKLQNTGCHLSTRSRTIFPKYTERERKKAYMCSTKTAHPLSHSCFGLTIFMLYPKALANIMLIIFYNHQGTIMEIKSTRSFNAIPATIIRSVFNLHVSNLLCKMYCKYLCIFSFFFNHCRIF